MSPKDIESIEGELSIIWKRLDETANRVRLLEDSQIRYEGKLDQLLKSMGSLLENADCRIHQLSIVEVKDRVTCIESDYVRKTEMAELKCAIKEGFQEQTAKISATNKTLWAIGLILLTAIISIGVDNVYGTKHVAPAQQIGGQR